MKKFNYSLAPWISDKKGQIMDAEGYKIAKVHTYSAESEPNENLVLLAPTLHEVFVKCQGILSNYLESGRKIPEELQELLDVLDDNELVIKLKELRQ